MIRTIAMGIVMAFALGFVGCRSCMAPYDHCQPTFIPERGDQCMGELYRCGSVLGGSERESSASGDCENCGGGNVEYYSANGYDAQSAAASGTKTAQVESSEPLEAYSSVNYEAPAGASAANEYATFGSAGRSALPGGVSTDYSPSFDANEFRLNDDATEYAVDR